RHSRPRHRHLPVREPRFEVDAADRRYRVAQLLRHGALLRAAGAVSREQSITSRSSGAIKRMSRLTKLLVVCLFVLVCFGEAVSQTEQVRLKLADGSYMTVDDAWESPQGIWYRRGGLSHLLAKEKVKKIERSTPEPAPAPSATTNNNKDDDDHFEVPEMAAARTPSNNGTYDQPAWIYLKGGARVEADSASQSPAGVWYKRGAMSIFIDAARVDRIETEDPATVAQSGTSGKKATGWSTGRAGLDS